MSFIRVLLLCMITLFSFFIGNKCVLAQTLNPVLVEAPKPLGDVRGLRREPDLESLRIVSERLAPELKAVPIRYRSFMFFPKLETTQTVNTNIFATSQNEEIDTITSIAPSLFIIKDYQRHQMNLLLEGKLDKYWSNNDEDIANFKTKLGGQLEATQDISFPYEFEYRLSHEKRSQNFSSNFTKKPTAFTNLAAATGINFSPNRLNLSLIGRYNQISYDNGVNQTGQQIIKDDSDYDSKTLELKSSYEILPNHTPYITLTARKNDYKRNNYQAGSYSGRNRSNKNYSVVGGWNLAYKGLVQGNLGLGISKRNYSDPQLENISALNASGSLNWNFTSKSTLSLAIGRSITEDNDVVQGAILSQQRIQLDHEFLHNLFFKAFLDKALLDFTEINREDDIYGLGTGFRYIINPSLSFTGDYSYQTRSSDQVGQDYDRHEFMIRLKKQF